MDRPESTHTSSSRAQKTKGIPSTGASVIAAQAEAVSSYVYDHVGINQETGEIGKCYFNNLLEDWSKFEIDNRTKYDATVASSIALLGSQKYIKPKKEQTFNMNQFVKKYKNTGIISKRIWKLSLKQ